MGAELAVLGALAATQYISSEDAKKQNKKSQNNAIKATNQQRREALPLLAEGEAYTRKSADALTSGFDDGSMQLDRTEALGRRDLTDQRTRVGAETEQRLTDRGLGGTTIGAQAQRSVGTAYARDLADFSTRMGALRASFARQKAQARSQAFGQLADFQAYKRDVLAQPLNAQAQIYSNQNFSGGNLDLSGIGALLALNAGGGGGGGAGKPFSGGGTIAPSGYNASQYGAFSY
jgi:hypothetical protein